MTVCWTIQRHLSFFFGGEAAPARLLVHSAGALEGDVAAKARLLHKEIAVEA
jgi:hypothetical protein